MSNPHEERRPCPLCGHRVQTERSARYLMGAFGFWRLRWKWAVYDTQNGSIRPVSLHRDMIDAHTAAEWLNEREAQRTTWERNKQESRRRKQELRAQRRSDI